MENHPKFDLSQAVAAWSRCGGAGAPLLPEEAAQREASLLKAIGDLQLRGLTPEEAFHIAVSRLEGQALPEDSYPKTEKQSVWWPRLSWMVGGLVVLDFIGATVGFLTEIPRLQGGDPPWL
jgi:hypothetical protein